MGHETEIKGCVKKQDQIYFFKIEERERKALKLLNRKCEFVKQALINDKNYMQSILHSLCQNKVRTICIRCFLRRIHLHAP